MSTLVGRERAPNGKIDAGYKHRLGNLGLLEKYFPQLVYESFA